MRIPGPYSDDSWDLLPANENRSAKAKNGFPQVAWELGLVLLVPLVGAGVVEFVLSTLKVY